MSSTFYLATAEMSSTFYRGYHTELADTAITEAIPAVIGLIPRLLKVEYINGITEHTLTVMRAVGTTTTTGEAISGQANISVASINPGRGTDGTDEALTGNDYIGWMDENGQWFTSYVSSVAGHALGLVGNLTTDIPYGSTIYAFYEVGRATHTQFKLPASVTTTIEGIFSGGFPIQQGVKTSRSGSGDPIVIHIDNITNAGKLQFLVGDYVPDTNLVLG